MADCQSLPLLPDAKPLLLADDAVDDANVSAQYYACAESHRGLVKWVRNAVLRIRELEGRLGAGP